MAIDQRIASYSKSRYALNRMSVRNLEKLAKTNCESVMKLMGQQPDKPCKVNLLIKAISNQRKFDLKLLKTCRDESIKIGVPENQLPWTYVELHDGEGNKKDNEKEKQGKDNKDNDKKENDDNKGKGKNVKFDDKKEDKKQKKQSLAKKINKMYSDLEVLKQQHDELNEHDEKKQPFSAPDNTNGNGNNQISYDYQSTAMQQQNQQLKSRIMKQMNGRTNTVPAKDVS